MTVLYLVQVYTDLQYAHRIKLFLLVVSYLFFQFAFASPYLSGAFIQEGLRSALECM